MSEQKPEQFGDPVEPREPDEDFTGPHQRPAEAEGDKG